MKMTNFTKKQQEYLLSFDNDQIQEFYKPFFPDDGPILVDSTGDRSKDIAEAVSRMQHFFEKAGVFDYERIFPRHLIEYRDYYPIYECRDMSYNCIFYKIGESETKGTITRISKQKFKYLSPESTFEDYYNNTIHINRGILSILKRNRARSNPAKHYSRASFISEKIDASKLQKRLQEKPNTETNLKYTGRWKTGKSYECLEGERIYTDQDIMYVENFLGIIGFFAVKSMRHLPGRATSTDTAHLDRIMLSHENWTDKAREEYERETEYYKAVVSRSGKGFFPDDGPILVDSTGDREKDKKEAEKRMIQYFETAARFSNERSYVNRVLESDKNCRLNIRDSRYGRWEGSRTYKYRFWVYESGLYRDDFGDYTSDWEEGDGIVTRISPEDFYSTLIQEFDYEFSNDIHTNHMNASNSPSVFLDHKHYGNCTYIKNFLGIIGYFRVDRKII